MLSFKQMRHADDFWEKGGQEKERENFRVAKMLKNLPRDLMVRKFQPLYFFMYF